MKYFLLISTLVLMSCSSSKNTSTSSLDPDFKAKELYSKHCAECHANNRYGSMGPALLPDNLERIKKSDALSITLKGRQATQMPGFESQIKAEEAQLLIDYLYRPLSEMPVWNIDDIQKSHKIQSDINNLSIKPQYKADPLNLFFVVELGDHHVTVLDGDKFEKLDRFPTAHALHGGIKYTPDGRYAFYSSRDGWINSYDVYNLKPIAEIRAGLNTRNIAVSADGKYVAVGNYLPHDVVILKAPTLEVIKVLPALTSKNESSRVSAIYTARPRNSFVVALKDAPELFELDYTNNFEMKRFTTVEPLDDFFFDQDYKNILGSSRKGEGWVINLSESKPAKKVPLSGMPHLGSGISWMYKGKRVIAAPNLRENKISILDSVKWEILKEIPTEGPGFFLRSHEKTPYAWADVFLGKNKDSVLLIDKRRLEITKTLQPAPGKTAAHVEFDRWGKYALLSIWEDPGELLIIDTKTLKIKKRIPMRKPSGKYNIYNKTRLSEGTSH